VPAWRVSRGDVSPSGARVVGVCRDESRGRVKIGFSDGSELDLAGERRVLVEIPRLSAGVRFVLAARRARRYLGRG
jgi:hypothetical protein